MAKNRFYARVSRVENFIVMLLTKYSVSENIFTDMLPVTIKSEWNDMVLVLWLLFQITMVAIR